MTRVRNVILKPSTHYWSLASIIRTTSPTLDEAILSCLGIIDESNTTLDFYFKAMDEHAGKIGSKEETVIEQTKEVFAKLKGIAGHMRE